MNEDIKALLKFYAILSIPFMLICMGIYILSESIGIYSFSSLLIALPSVFIINYLQISFNKEVPE
jgi:hypothetical protein